MDFAKISKAIAGGIAGSAVGSPGYIAIPQMLQTTLPWWGNVLIGVANFAIGFAAVYFAPANKP